VADVPSSAGEAVDMVLAGLGWLARADAASMPGPVQAECLRGLEIALSVHAAARARVLAAFTAQGSYEDDGQGSPRTWLTWQTKVTRPAASGALGSMRSLAAHPAIADALASGQISVSWARQIAEWTDLLPEDCRLDADVILLAAAAAGADLPALGDLAEEIRRRTARPDRDVDDGGFADRGLRLATTLGGAGKLHGDLTGRCAAALQEVLDSLGKKAGPEDTRTAAQRRHDALEEACRRLLAAGCLPDRAGQPARLQLHLTLRDFLHGTGHPGPGDSRDGGNGGASRDGPVLPGPAAGPGDDCDAAFAPIVTGHVDHDLLNRLAARVARTPGQWAEFDPDQHPDRGHDGTSYDGDGTRSGQTDDHTNVSRTAGARLGLAAARELILRNAVALLSGPGGLASWLRTGTLTGPAASISLPLDVGTVTDLIPAHLRRAVTVRDRHCAAPGCDQPPAACQVHHIIPRSQGGATKLTNLLLLCSFHHLILIHRWGWTITLNADGTTTATSPDRHRILHSHSPPERAA
jgi:hypothetical protein